MFQFHELRGGKFGGRPHLNNLLVGISLVVLPLVLAGYAHPSPPPSSDPSADRVTEDKALLGRLVTELKQSSRSFIYLRSKGFTQSDKEFEEIIAKNDAVLRRTRIVRRDEHGIRQIPGWPGVALTDEFKGAPRRGKQSSAPSRPQSNVASER